MMNQGIIWMSSHSWGLMIGGMWIWTVFCALIILLLLVMISKIPKE